jgi:hypothetical protein
MRPYKGKPAIGTLTFAFSAARQERSFGPLRVPQDDAVIRLYVEQERSEPGSARQHAAGKPANCAGNGGRYKCNGKAAAKQERSPQWRI